MGRNNDCINVACETLQKEEASLDQKFTLVNQKGNNIIRYYEHVQIFSKECLNVMPKKIHNAVDTILVALLSSLPYIKKKVPEAASFYNLW